MKTPHAFVPVIYQGTEMLRCDACAMFRGHPLHVETLPGMETVDADRESAGSGSVWISTGQERRRV
jgi:hypothetical protein